MMALAASTARPAAGALSASSRIDARRPRRKLREPIMWRGYATIPAGTRPRVCGLTIVRISARRLSANTGAEQ